MSSKIPKPPKQPKVKKTTGFVSQNNTKKSDLKKQYQKELQELENMGFVILNENLQALILNKGNLENAINALLNGGINVPTWLEEDDEEEFTPEIKFEETLELEEDVWSKISLENPPKERVGFSTVLYQDKVYIYGCKDGKNFK